MNKQISHATPIQLRAFEASPSAPYKVAILQGDLLTERNYVSSRVVKHLMEQEIPSRRRETNKVHKILRKRYTVAGDIVIEWRLQNSAEKKKMHCTVVMDDDSSWDIIAGRQYLQTGELAPRLVDSQRNRQSER
jgi:hypothetical protein